MPTGTAKRMRDDRLCRGELGHSLGALQVKIFTSSEITPHMSVALPIRGIGRGSAAHFLTLHGVNSTCSVEAVEGVSAKNDFGWAPQTLRAWPARRGG